jgi:hypothetical protein
VARRRWTGTSAANTRLNGLTGCSFRRTGRVWATWIPRCCATSRWGTPFPTADRTAEFVVVKVDAPHALVLHSTTHLPPAVFVDEQGRMVDFSTTDR